MASHRKLGKRTDLRLAILKNQVSQLLWNGKLETTEARAKEVQKLAEKYITLAVNSYKDTINVQKTKIV
ncbi:MAG: bL17 family ribosomal protein, partial [Clostridiales bacterium]|nr:bL17 family ribosomal protein [Clostridiales bacterium]